MQKASRMIPDIIFVKIIARFVLLLTDGNGFLEDIGKFHTFGGPENGDCSYLRAQCTLVGKDSLSFSEILCRATFAAFSSI